MQTFMNYRFKLKNNQKGMTLIELMAVVVILGILAAVAGAAVTKGFDSSKKNADAASIKVVSEAAQRYVMDTGTTTGITTATLVSNGYLSSEPKAQEDITKVFKIAVDSTSKVVTVTIAAP